VLRGEVLMVIFAGMKRPNKEEYIGTVHQVDFQDALRRYYEDLEKYCSYLDHTKSGLSVRSSSPSLPFGGPAKEIKFPSAPDIKSDIPGDYQFQVSGPFVADKLEVNDVRQVMLPVKVLMSYSSTAFVDEVDEDGVVMSYRPGWTGKVLPGQAFEVTEDNKGIRLYSVHDMMAADDSTSKQDLYGQNRAQRLLGGTRPGSSE
jgi:hypothetical protein